MLCADDTTVSARTTTVGLIIASLRLSQKTHVIMRPLSIF
jgi:hypothetical protein